MTSSTNKLSTLQQTNLLKPQPTPNQQSSDSSPLTYASRPPRQAKTSTNQSSQNATFSAAPTFNYMNQTKSSSNKKAVTPGSSSVGSRRENGHNQGQQVGPLIQPSYPICSTIRQSRSANKILPQDQQTGSKDGQGNLTAINMQQSRNGFLGSPNSFGGQVNSARGPKTLKLKHIAGIKKASLTRNNMQSATNNYQTQTLGAQNYSNDKKEVKKREIDKKRQSQTSLQQSPNLKAFKGDRSKNKSCLSGLFSCIQPKLTDQTNNQGRTLETRHAQITQTQRRLAKSPDLTSQQHRRLTSGLLEMPISNKNYAQLDGKSQINDKVNRLGDESDFQAHSRRIAETEIDQATTAHLQVSDELREGPAALSSECHLSIRDNSGRNLAIPLPNQLLKVNSGMSGNRKTLKQNFDIQRRVHSPKMSQTQSVRQIKQQKNGYNGPIFSKQNSQSTKKDKFGENFEAFTGQVIERQLIQPQPQISATQNKLFENSPLRANIRPPKASIKKQTDVSNGQNQGNFVQSPSTNLLGPPHKVVKLASLVSGIQTDQFLKSNPSSVTDTSFNSSERVPEINPEEIIANQNLNSQEFENTNQIVAFQSESSKREVFNYEKVSQKDIEEQKELIVLDQLQNERKNLNQDSNITNQVDLLKLQSLNKLRFGQQSIDLKKSALSQTQHVSLRYESQIFKSVEVNQTGLDNTQNNVRIGPNLDDQTVFSGDMKIIVDSVDNSDNSMVQIQEKLNVKSHEKIVNDKTINMKKQAGDLSVQGSVIDICLLSKNSNTNDRQTCSENSIPYDKQISPNNQAEKVDLARLPKDNECQKSQQLINKNRASFQVKDSFLSQKSDQRATNKVNSSNSARNAFNHTKSFNQKDDPAQAYDLQQPEIMSENKKTQLDSKKSRQGKLGPKNYNNQSSSRGGSRADSKSISSSKSSGIFSDTQRKTPHIKATRQNNLANNKGQKHTNEKVGGANGQQAYLAAQNTLFSDLTINSKKVAPPSKSSSLISTSFAVVNTQRDQNNQVVSSQEEGQADASNREMYSKNSQTTINEFMPTVQDRFSAQQKSEKEDILNSVKFGTESQDSELNQLIQRQMKVESGDNSMLLFRDENQGEEDNVGVGDTNSVGYSMRNPNQRQNHTRSFKDVRDRRQNKIASSLIYGFQKPPNVAESVIVNSRKKKFDTLGEQKSRKASKNLSNRSKSKRNSRQIQSKKGPHMNSQGIFSLTSDVDIPINSSQKSKMSQSRPLLTSSSPDPLSKKAFQATQVKSSAVLEARKLRASSKIDDLQNLSPFISLNNEPKSGSKLSKQDILRTQSDYFAYKSARSGHATKVKSNSVKSRQSKNSVLSQQKSNPYQLKQTSVKDQNLLGSFENEADSDMKIGSGSNQSSIVQDKVVICKNEENLQKVLQNNYIGLDQSNNQNLQVDGTKLQLKLDTQNSQAETRQSQPQIIQKSKLDSKPQIQGQHDRHTHHRLVTSEDNPEFLTFTFKDTNQRSQSRSGAIGADQEIESRDSSFNPRAVVRVQSSTSQFNSRALVRESNASNTRLTLNFGNVQQNAQSELSAEDIIQKGQNQIDSKSNDKNQKDLPKMDMVSIDHVKIELIEEPEDSYGVSQQDNTQTGTAKNASKDIDKPFYEDLRPIRQRKKFGLQLQNQNENSQGFTPTDSEQSSDPPSNNPETAPSYYALRNSDQLGISEGQSSRKSHQSGRSRRSRSDRKKERKETPNTNNNFQPQKTKSPLKKRVLPQQTRNKQSTFQKIQGSVLNERHARLEGGGITTQTARSPLRRNPASQMILSPSAPSNIPPSSQTLTTMMMVKENSNNSHANMIKLDQAGGDDNSTNDYLLMDDPGLSQSINENQFISALQKVNKSGNDSGKSRVKPSSGQIMSKEIPNTVDETRIEPESCPGSENVPKKDTTPIGSNKMLVQSSTSTTHCRQKSATDLKTQSKKESLVEVELNDSSEKMNKNCQSHGKTSQKSLQNKSGSQKKSAKNLEKSLDSNKVSQRSSLSQKRRSQLSRFLSSGNKEQDKSLASVQKDVELGIDCEVQQQILDKSDLEQNKFQVDQTQNLLNSKEKTLKRRSIDSQEISEMNSLPQFQDVSALVNPKPTQSIHKSSIFESIVQSVSDRLGNNDRQSSKFNSQLNELEQLNSLQNEFQKPKKLDEQQEFELLEEMTRKNLNELEQLRKNQQKTSSENQSIQKSQDSKNFNLTGQSRDNLRDSDLLDGFGKFNTNDDMMIDIPDVGLLKSIDREDMLLNSDVDLLDQPESQLKEHNNTGQGTKIKQSNVLDLLDDCIKDQEENGLMLDDEALLDGSDVRLTGGGLEANNSTALKLMDLSPSDAATPSSLFFEKQDQQANEPENGEQNFDQLLSQEKEKTTNLNENGERQEFDANFIQNEILQGSLSIIAEDKLEWHDSVSMTSEASRQMLMSASNRHLTKTESNQLLQALQNSPAFKLNFGSNSTKKSQNQAALNQYQSLLINSNSKNQMLLLGNTGEKLIGDVNSHGGSRVNLSDFRFEDEEGKNSPNQNDYSTISAQKAQTARAGRSSALDQMREPFFTVKEEQISNFERQSGQQLEDFQSKNNTTLQSSSQVDGTVANREKESSDFSSNASRIIMMRHKSVTEKNKSEKIEKESEEQDSDLFERQQNYPEPN